MTNLSAPLHRCAQIFRYSLISLPFLSYVTFPGFLYVMGRLYRRYPTTALDRVTRLGLLAIAGFLCLGTLTAYNREQALLQLANFMPFFALFAIVPFVLMAAVQMEQLALGLVIGSLPLNGFAMVQFLLKLGLRQRWFPRGFRRSPLGEWARSLPHQNRVSSVFDHPNVFASYLVLILGLGLGLWLYRLTSPALSSDESDWGHRLQGWQYRLLPLALGFTLVGLYTSGSRNGIGVAVLQGLVFCGFMVWKRGDRRIVYTSLVGLSALLVCIMFAGLAGRVVSVDGLANDPRLDVWAIAFDLFRQKPWLGWGLGSYAELYPALTTNTQYDYISHTHNLWLLLTTEVGIFVTVGLTLIIGRIYFHSALTLIRKAFVPSSALLLGYVLAFGGAIAFACFDVTFYDARINFINWSILAALFAQTPLLQCPDLASSGAEHGTPAG